MVSGLLVLSVCALLWALHARLADASDLAEIPSVLLFVVRHAEKERGVSNAGLTRGGHRRAKALAELLGDTDLAVIFTSDYRRCLETVEPLARARSLEPTVIEAADPHRQIAELRSLPAGSAALLCGHANTVPALIGALGGRVTGLTYGMIAESCYDQLFVVTYPAGPDASSAATTVHLLRYGETCER